MVLGSMVLGSMVLGSMDMSTYKQITYLKNNLSKIIDYKAGTIDANENNL